MSRPKHDVQALSRKIRAAYSQMRKELLRRRAMEINSGKIGIIEGVNLDHFGGVTVRLVMTRPRRRLRLPLDEVTFAVDAPPRP